jgi:hypothetical protein
VSWAYAIRPYDRSPRADLARGDDPYVAPQLSKDEAENVGCTPLLRRGAFGCERSLVERHEA